MKKLSSCLLILTFFISCDNASDITPDIKNPNQSNRIATELPGNAANPYDEAGWVHNALFESYYEIGSKPTTVSGIISKVQALADANSNFIGIKTSAYKPISANDVQYLLDHKNTCITDVISASSLTTKAKLSLITFINSLIVVFDTETNCDMLYKFVADYEKEILNDSLLTVKDKQIMLITTSIARHTTYLAKKKPKKNTDPDWTILVGHVMAAAEGAEEDSAKAVTLALVTGIAQN